jgi:hypothetical protein
MKKTLIVLLSTTFMSVSAQAENCEGFADKGMNCFENNTPANANKVNQNFKILADEVEQLKTAQPPENSGGGNVSYIRWGRVSCPSDASLIYKGYAASGHYNHKGGISSQLCLTDKPTFANGDVSDGNQNGALLYGTEYETSSYGINSLKNLHNFSAPCAVCLKPASISLMIPGTLKCPASWDKEYEGYLMGTHYTQTSSHEAVCVDIEAEKVVNSSSASQDGNLWYPTEAECGALPCPPYVQNRELSCVVCTK